MIKESHPGALDCEIFFEGKQVIENQSKNDIEH